MGPAAATYVRPRPFGPGRARTMDTPRVETQASSPLRAPIHVAATGVEGDQRLVGYGDPDCYRRTINATAGAEGTAMRDAHQAIDRPTAVVSRSCRSDGDCKKRRRLSRAPWTLGPLAVVALFAACGGNDDNGGAATDSANTGSAETISTSTTLSQSSMTASSTGAPDTTSSTTTTTATPPPTTTTTTTLPPATTAAQVLMPDVVCMNLQDAQDTIQLAGVFFSRSDDASGRGRNQVLDRNWQVVAQTPAPGTPVGELEAVLSVVKYGEPSRCP